MKIAVVGGGLQGVEVVYLAKKAGYDVCLIDKRSRPPAKGLCADFRQGDVTDPSVLRHVVGDADLIFPALESLRALTGLHAWAVKKRIPIIYDPHAYFISSSKVESQRFFDAFDIPTPVSWPGCRFPVIAKPAHGSGSKGIRIFPSEEELVSSLGVNPVSKGWMVQEFIPGPTCSVEVIRYQGVSQAIQVTDLYMDQVYDCKRVTAPSVLDPELVRLLMDLSEKIADQLNLEGVMDVEAVYANGVFKVLEIDARFPSQTPITVFASCGMNMVQALVRLYTGETIKNSIATNNPVQGAILEHLYATPNLLATTGEQMMAGPRPLSLHPGFFGSNEAITDYEPGCCRWKATMINTGPNLDIAQKRRDDVVAAIRSRFRLDGYEDSVPPPINPTVA